MEEYGGFVDALKDPDLARITTCPSCRGAGCNLCHNTGLLDFREMNRTSRKKMEQKGV